MHALRALQLILCLPILAGTAATLAADLPTPEEYRANWPRFRGPDGSGVSALTDLPLTCDPKTGANLAWTANVLEGTPRRPVRNAPHELSSRPLSSLVADGPRPRVPRLACHSP